MIAALVITGGVIGFWYACIIAPPLKIPFVANLGNLDFFAQILPMSARGADWIRQGILPLWNPFQMAGHPFLATGLYGVLYPFNFPYLALPTEMAIEAVVVLHMAMAGWFVWLYAAEIGLSSLARYAGAATYVGSGFMAGQASWFTPAVASSTWLPLAFFAIERVIARRDGRSAMILAFAIAMPLLGGWVQFWLYSMYAIALYATVRLAALTWHPTTRELVVPVALLLMAGVVIGGALTAAQALPTRELQALGPRRPGGLTPEQQLAYPSLQPARVASEAIDPRLTRPYTSPFHVGPIVLAVAAWSLFSKRGSSRVATLWALAILSFLTCIGLSTPFYTAVYLRLPAATWFRIPQRAAFLLAFAVSLLTALGLDAFTEIRGRGRWIAYAISSTILVVSLLVFVQHSPLPIRHLVLIALTIGGLLVGTGLDVPGLRTALAAGIVGLLLAWSVQATTNPFRHPYHQPGALHRQDAIVSYIREHQGLDRTFLADPNGFQYGVMPKQGSLAGIFAVTDYEPLSLLRFEQLYALMRRPVEIDIPFVGGLDLDPKSPNRGLLDALSVRFVVSARNAPVARWLASAPDTWRRIPLPAMNGYELYESIRPLPRAYVATHAQAVPDGQAALNALSAPGFDVRTAVVVESTGNDATVGSSPIPSPVVPARITRYEPREVRIEAEAPVSGTLVLTDTWYPGWIATVDGARTDILPANHVVRGVPLTAGRHEVVFRYEPMPFFVGVWVSGAALLTLLGVAVVNPRLSRRP